MKSVSRRDFLKISMIGVGAATLSACAPKATEVPATEAPVMEATSAPEEPVAEPTAEPVAAPVVEVEVTTSGWPVDVKSEDDIKADVNNASYAAAVQAWLDANPGTKLTKLNVNIWDPQNIQAQVAAGTDCTYLFGPCVGGGWGNLEAQNAFVQGLLADVTSLVAKWDLEKKSVPDLWKIWSAKTQVDSKYWAYPLNEYSPSANVWIYRKDLIKELGLTEPQVGWKWEDVDPLWKGLTDSTKGRFGGGMPQWFTPATTSYHGSDVLTFTPAPKAAWHWDRDWSDPKWVEVVGSMRKMLFEDKSMVMEVGKDFAEMIALFKAGNACFCYDNFWGMWGSPTDPNSYAAFADNLKKTYPEVIGVIPVPTGDGYQSGGGVEVSGGASFSPNQTTDQLDKGISLIDWMFWDKGLDMTKAGMWESTKDPRAVFTAFMYMSGKQGYEGVPGSAVDAWGETAVNAWFSIAGMPTEPTKESFVPAEANPGPNTQTIDDQFSKFYTDPDPALDVAGLLAEGVKNWQSAASGFASSVAEADFAAGAQKYYAALDDFYKTNYADFYENRYKPYYEGKVLPAIS